MELSVRLLVALCAIFWVERISVNGMIGRGIYTTEPDEYSFIVSLMHRNVRNPVPINDHICTAVLLSPLHVLSAAQCIENRLVNETMVVAGTNTLIFGSTYGIDWWLNYNDWANLRRIDLPDFDNDVAVMKLSDVIDLPIRSAIISPVYAPNFYDTEAVMVGYGRTNNGRISNIALKARVRVLTNHICASRITALQGYRTRLHSKLLCTSAQPFVLLHDGDFGGPLLSMGQVIAIHKDTRPFGVGNFHPEKVNVHTSINIYRPFIADVTRNDFHYEYAD